MFTLNYSILEFVHILKYCMVDPIENISFKENII